MAWADTPEPPEADRSGALLPTESNENLPYPEFWSIAWSVVRLIWMSRA